MRVPSALVRLSSLALAAFLTACAGVHPPPPTPGGGGAASCICAEGKAQSPIELKPAAAAPLPVLDLAYETRRAELVRTKTSFEVRLSPPLVLTIRGERFELVEFHFHAPGEHEVGGKKTAMELHLVHRNAVGELAAVGVFLREGRFNRAIQEIWDHTLPGPVWSFDPRPLLPPDRAYFRYAGSLTTPPCAEGVRWYVFAQPIEIAPEQVKAYVDQFGRHSRDVQDRNGRPVLKTGAGEG